METVQFIHPYKSSAVTNGPTLIIENTGNKKTHKNKTVYRNDKIYICPRGSVKHVDRLQLDLKSQFTSLYFKR